MPVFHSSRMELTIWESDQTWTSTQAECGDMKRLGEFQDGNELLFKKVLSNDTELFLKEKLGYLLD